VLLIGCPRCVLNAFILPLLAWQMLYRTASQSALCKCCCTVPQAGHQMTRPAVAQLTVPNRMLAELVTYRCLYLCHRS
jgi:hypothetical protein